MIRNRNNFFITGALIISTLFTSCYSSQQFVQPSLSSNISSRPQYLDNLSINGPERSLSISSRSAESCDGNVKTLNGNGLKAKYAALLRVVPETILNLSLYRFIDEWYGVRYKLGGNSKEGIDCSAFVQRAYEQVFGMNLLRTALDQFSMSNLIWKKDQCKEGDLVFFNIKGSKISHVGIYLINNFFVHASSTHGIMISSLDEQYWNKYYACAGRVL